MKAKFFVDPRNRRADALPLPGDPGENKSGPLVKWPKTPASHAGNTSSNLVRVTILKRFKRLCRLYIVGVDGVEGPPVPIPNTVVKLNSAEDT